MKNGRFQYYKKCVSEEAFFLRFFGDAFLMAIIRWVMDENIMLPGEFVKQLDATIFLGAQKIIEAKQKKGLLCNKLYTSPNVSKNYTPAV